MRVQILEKVYHSSENPTLLTSLRRTRELFWIKELGTAKPYDFNDQIKGVGTLSSISCKKTNIYSLFNKQPRRKRSHGKRHYNKRTPQPDATTLTINSSAGPWLALANSMSNFIGCLGCRMSRQPGPAKEDSAFLASIIQWQFLAISADDRGFVGTLGRWSRVSRHMVLAFSATGQEFVSILGGLSRISRQSWPKICQYCW